LDELTLPDQVEHGYIKVPQWILAVVFLMGLIFLLKQSNWGFLFFLLPGIYMTSSTPFMIWDGQIPLGNILISILLFITLVIGWSLRTHFDW